jgi:hypothetical protein
VIRVELTAADVDAIRRTAQLRQHAAEQQGRPDRHGYNGDTPGALHLAGCVGELALARALTVPWEQAVNTYHSRPDVAGYEVRCRQRHDYELIHRAEDDPTRRYALVTWEQRNPWEALVHGWLLGTDCRRPEWQQTHGNRPPAWFVPHDALRPFVDGYCDTCWLDGSYSSMTPGYGTAHTHDPGLTATPSR